jgi:hypothetical protein
MEAAAIDPANPELKKLELQCVQQMSAPGENLTCFTCVTSTKVQILPELEKLELHCVQQMSVERCLQSVLWVGGGTSVWGLKLLVYEALSFLCMRP